MRAITSGVLDEPESALIEFNFSEVLVIQLVNREQEPPFFPFFEISV